MTANFGNSSSDSGSSDSQGENPVLAKAKEARESTTYVYTERDVLLYNLSVGATEKELQWAFESDGAFGAIPTFGVVPQFAASSGIALDFLPDFNPVCGPNSFCRASLMLALLRRSCFTESSSWPSKRLSLPAESSSARQG
jgi:hypothetical protein